MYDLKNISIEVPDSVRYILDTIQDAGYQAYIVGGCVRDYLLNKKPDDWDITTSALPEQVMNLFHATVGTGIKHGTVMVLRGGCGYEVTTYRIDGEYKDGRHPESVMFTPSLEEDLKRRDFTINAFAYCPHSGIVDLFGGIEDLAHGVIRAVGNPEKRFAEDALRIMRAVRFSAQLSFEIEADTKNAITAFAPKLKMVSAERIRVEFEKTLYSSNPAMVNDYAGLGLAQYIIPDFSDRCFDEHSAEMLNCLKQMDSDEFRAVRLAAFFRNLNEDECKSVMRKMTFDNRTISKVCLILKYKDDLPDASAESVRRMLKLTGSDGLKMILDFRQSEGIETGDLREILRGIIDRGEAWSLSMLDISGRDLLEQGIPGGSRIGEILNMLLDKVIEKPELNKKEILLKLAADYAV